MSEDHDDFVRAAGMVSVELLGRRHKIRVCKDRTLSVTEGSERPFNGVAIAVYSTDTREMAEDIVMALGSLQYISHPAPHSASQMPYGQWRKITLDSEPFAREFEYQHLSEIQAKILRAHNMILFRRAENAA